MEDGGRFPRREGMNDGTKATRRHGELLRRARSGNLVALIATSRREQRRQVLERLLRERSAPGTA